MFYFGLLILLISSVSTIASAIAVVCTKLTLGNSRSSALVWYGLSQLYSVALAAVVQSRFDGTHLLGVMLGAGALYTVFVRQYNNRWA